MTIIRVKHNKENPYVMLNKQTIWDKNLSLRALGLWMKCMSRPDDWCIRIKELASKCVEGIRAVYSTIDELEAARYILKVKHYEKSNNGKFESGGVEYIVFETPYTDQERDEAIEELKKCFRQSGFCDVGERHVPKSTLLSNESSYSKKILKKEDTNSSEVSDCPPSGGENGSTEIIKEKEIPEEASEIAKELLAKIKAIHPKCKDPDLKKWALELEKLNRIDKRSWEDIKSMVSWAFEDAFWYQVIQSPSNLRKHWDKMQVRRSPAKSIGKVISDNKNVALEIKSHLRKSNRDGLLFLGPSYVRNTRTNDDLKYDLPTAQFEEVLCKWFGLKKE